MTIRHTAEYGSLNLEETFRLLDSTADGLHESDAIARTAQFGYNEIAEPRSGALRDLIGRFWAPMPWLLELTIALSLALGRFLDAGIVTALLTINVAVGYINSSRSQKALRILMKHLAPSAKVYERRRMEDHRDKIPRTRRLNSDWSG